MQGRLLVAYSNSSNFVSTTAEYLDSLAKHCNLQVRYVHVTNGAKLDFDLNEFDAVFQSYCVRLPVDNYVGTSYIEQMKSFRGVKMLAAQDEYEDTGKLKSGMQEIGFQVFFTNAAGGMIEQLYPRREFPNTDFVTVLTGYVPEQLEARGRNPMPLRERPIHIGYRCRRLPSYFGRLGVEKFEIGRRMREICEARGIPHDIEWTDDKRLYGEAWYDFIASCRANLGSETGSNVFDFDGTIRAKYEKMSAARGGPVPFEEFRVYTDPVEAKYDIGQISPRIFEAAALRTPLILFSGKYLGLISPDEHYIELKKDFSNIDAVLDRLADVDGLETMADRAYDRLVGSGEFSYRRFAGLVEETVRRKAAELGMSLRPATAQFGPTEFGVQLASLVESREEPTVAPRHPVFFLYQNAMQQNRHYLKELDRLNEFYNGRIAHLNEHIAQQNESLSNEIARLNEYYPERIDYLNSYIITQNEDFTREIHRLNEYYPEQIARLNTHISEQNTNFKMETARLTEFYSSRIDQLNAVIAENRGKWRGALAAHPRGTFGWAMHMLVGNSLVRRLGRKIMAHLPDQVGRRIKSRVVLLLNR